ncbi:NAD(P)H-dependent oxidoreductase [Chelatococcus sp. SYSU_G07232]|uniref:NAD(P)H-dependent oxidoreductase n=1 Tax=Chelatococcus albus TaxID=3047466 RepID=A0ABT7AG73_9HYPH|nr:NAD(P)H-dependent oxidoreductase [Chelatococcus sp. SYSU_G07232]MDJ1158369.1 NAD(P)H-dependent oxidoreductase [Chelatococcus sp. SYSU_G07232]
MRFLVLHAHPDPDSYSAALHAAVVGALAAAGHAVDDCDLHAEHFDPVLSRDERRAYHDLAQNRLPVADYVRRLEAAEGLVLVYPVWNFGFPAILKGFLDRVFLPGVSFRIENGLVRPNLRRITRLAAVTTYGAPRWRACLMGDPPRKCITRVLRALAASQARTRYLAHYDMNRSTPATREAFLRDVRHCMEHF